MTTLLRMLLLGHTLLAAWLWRTLDTPARLGAGYVTLLLLMAVLGDWQGRREGRRMPQVFCAEPGCKTLVTAGRCAVHAAAVRAAEATVHRWYCSARWQRLRLQVLQDQPFCAMCRVDGKRTLALEVDHVVAHRGDPILFWDVHNLQGLCRPCHTRKTTAGG